MGVYNMSYSPPYLLRHNHISTLFPYFFPNSSSVPYERIELPTSDDDFLDIDCILNNRSTAAVLCHGLEGNSCSTYLVRLASMLSSSMDIFAVNYRGCSGRPNRTYKAYHSGATYDLDILMNNVYARGYTQVILVGFSLGGNLVLKFAGEREQPTALKAVIGISVPSDLAAASRHLSRWDNRLYNVNFLRALKKKAIQKLQYPEAAFTYKELMAVRTLTEYDDLYTAHAHGFLSASDYYNQCSSKQFIRHIRIPTLIINAQNDPFLAPDCHPVQEANDNPCVTFLLPMCGGHVGFWPESGASKFWHETQILYFLKRILTPVDNYARV